MKTPPQRLVLCLDGTWNNRDDSTNVLHQSVLSLDSALNPGDGDNGGFFQRIYYDEGVGNGVLDGVTGGGFGIGLEENVREAYNWLIEHFNDAGSGKDYVADEIFVFGFSRGAYTARSLVGFIGRCGLLRRGAPLTVNELWSAYCLLGRQHEERTSVWDSVAGELGPPFREISRLTCDPWSRRSGGPDGAAPLSPAEQLLVQWSRRVRITYLGLYDTVGAMGLDALAIPGLRSRVALHHNMRPTTLIQHCRHALAIDEHRRSFQHTPFVAYYGHDHSEQELARADENDDAGKASKWQRAEAMWRRKIEQRWFIGAHSNVGGGYESNTLAQLPFAWVLEGARDAGLRCKPFDPPVPAAAALPAPNDSYVSFAAPFGTHVLRLKRNYRVIAPPDDIRAARPDATKGAALRPGFTLKSIHETVDPSVVGYYRASGRALPPNLARYFGLAPAEAGLPPATHHWPEGGWSALVWTPLWAALAAIGLGAVTFFFSGGLLVPPAWVMAVVAFGLVAVDWLESRINFTLARVTQPSPCRRAAQDSIYWTRALGVVLAATGAICTVGALLTAGWTAPTLEAAGARAAQFLGAWWNIIAASVAAVIACVALDGPRGARLAAPLGAVLVGALATVLPVGLAHATRRILGVELTTTTRYTFADLHAGALAGQVLLLQIGLAYFLRAFAWVGEPLVRVGLPSIARLQVCASPGAVHALLRRWNAMLVCSWREDPEFTGPAAQRMQTSVREALWRDIIGFIPVHGLVLGYGLWLASRWLDAPCPVAAWLGTSLLHFPLWCWIVVVAVVADWIEDGLHLRYLAAHARGKPPSAALTWPAFAASLVKFLAFGAGCAAALGALVSGTRQLFQLGPHIDWRGSLALLTSLGAASALVAVAYIWVRFKLVAPRLRQSAR